MLRLCKPLAKLDDAPFVERAITLHLVMSGVRSDSDESRLLEMTEARNLVLGCTPVINLFEQAC